MIEIHNWLATQFEAERPRLRAMAYRMLGSLAEAEDAVQDAWLNLSRSDTSTISNLGGWLTTVVARICLNMLQARTSRREESLESCVSTPVSSRTSGFDPEEEAELADSVGLALLVVLDTLTPAERLAFVLHDIFAMPFDEIAPLVERTPAATRQLASRARRRVHRSTMQEDTDLTSQRDIITAFLAAAREGSFDALLTMLDPNIVVRADHAAVSLGLLKEARGAQALARIAKGAKKILGSLPFAQPLCVEESLGIIAAPQGLPRLLLRLTIVQRKIMAVDIIADPAHLYQLHLAVLSD